jgi:superfamily II DNA or RNA helicase
MNNAPTTPVKDLNRVVTTKGYAIKKSWLTKEQITELRTDLTVSPITHARAAAVTSAFPIYLESASRFYVPRVWGSKQFGEAEANTLPVGQPLPAVVKFKGVAYDYQENIIQSFFANKSAGLICVPCGKGKTFMALNIAVRLGKRFLVVVDKEFLLNQWKKEIEGFIDGARIGILQGTKCEVDPKKYDVTLCMIQTLCSRDFPEDTFKTYGFTIFDECHHLGAAYFSKTLMKIQTKAVLGLSATPTRDDGLTKVFEWFLGEPVYWEKIREADETVSVRGVRFTSSDTGYSIEPTDDNGEIVMARLLTQVVECAERTKMIAGIIVDLAKDPNRRILVLSERIGHLNSLEALLMETNPGLIIRYYIGGMKEAKREAGAAEANVLLASYSMASEAMNIKSLNAVVLASPRKKVEQSTGRILRQRKEERKVDPLIVDIIDQHGMYIRQWGLRSQYYKQCGYKIQRSGGRVQDRKDEEETEKVEKAMKKCLIIDD